MRNFFVCFLLAASLHASASDSSLAFTSSGEGTFAFDTGVIRGTLRADSASQGVAEFVDVQTGADLAYGGGNPGILSYYRLFTTNKRHGDTARNAPKQAQLTKDGGARVHWPASDEVPFSMTATYRWTAPDTLDLETVVHPGQDLPDFEVFLSSYVNKNFKGSVYAKDPLHEPLKDRFISVDTTPLVEGTYLAFPRDRAATHIIYDGRWDLGQHPVQFSVTQQMALPLFLKHDAASGITLVWMSRPEDCFALASPYNMSPPDGVAGHFSVYLSLFGRDLKNGQPARALTRLVAGRNITHEKALVLYETFIREAK